MVRVTVVCLVLLCFGLPATASETDALLFIEGMLEGVHARTVRCSNDIVKAAENAEMGAVCATFKGHFEKFKSRCDAVRDMADLSDEKSRIVSRGRARTQWELSGENHERIYALGTMVIGIQFRDGEVLLIYK